MNSPDLYRALCLAISGRAGQVDWAGWSPGDWNDFYDQALAQGVAPLIYWTLKDAGWPEGAPGEIQTRFSKAYYETAAYNQLLYQELDRILLALKEAGVPVVVLKGAALAASLYADTGLRPMNDLDLLVPPRYLRNAIRAVRSCGYRVQKVTYHVVLWHEGPQNFTLELHWNLFDSPQPEGRTDAEWVWGHTEPYPGSAHGTKSDHGACVLAPALNLFHLASHLVLKHGGDQARLIWFHDLDLVIRHDGERLDWDQISAWARRYAVAPAFIATLWETQALLDTTVPESIFEGIDPEELKAELNRHRKEIDELQPDPAMVWRMLKPLEWSVRIQVLWNLIFPAPDYMHLYYEKRSFQPLSSLYFRRIIQIIRRVVSKS